MGFRAILSCSSKFCNKKKFGRSARLTRDQQLTSERFEWIYQESCYAKGARYQPGLSTLPLDKKHLQKHHRIFSDREPSRIPARTHKVWATRAESLENMFLLFTNVSVQVHLMYQSNRSFNIPPGNPRAFEFLENFCPNSPLPRPKSCSNAPS